MSTVLPVTTTTVSTTRDGVGDPFEAPTSVSTVLSGAPAHLSAPNGRETRGLGAQEVVDAVLYLEADADLLRQDTVTDDQTGAVYRVTWVRARRGLGLAYLVAGLTATAGSLGDST